MAVRDDPMSGENFTLKVYRWKEKEVSSTAVSGAAQAFTFSKSVVNLLGVKSTLLPDFVASATSVALRDYAAYYRKNGVDTRIDESAITSFSGTTLTLGSAPSQATADSIVASYAYTDSTNDGTTDFTFYMKGWGVNGGGRAVSTVKVAGGVSYKRFESQGTAEVQLTTIKKDVLLSQILNGDLVQSSGEVTTLNIKSTVGGGATTPRCLILTYTDPDNTTERLVTILRNVRGSANEWSGAADKELEETLTVSCNPQDMAEVEFNQL